MKQQCGIMRAAKRHISDLKALELEANREQDDYKKRTFENSKIDWDRTGENVFLIRSDDWEKSAREICDKVGVKMKSSSVAVIDCVFDVSRGWKDTHTDEELREYFNDCLQFAKEHFGPAINAVIHYDETTPHLQVACVPVTLNNDRTSQSYGQWTLSAKQVMGHKKDYIDKQDEFYEQVCKDRGLDRGISSAHSQRKHQTALEHKIEQEKAMLSVLEEIIDKVADDEIGRKTLFGGHNLSDDEYEDIQKLRGVSEGLDKIIAEASETKAAADKRIEEAYNSDFTRDMYENKINLLEGREKRCESRERDCRTREKELDQRENDIDEEVDRAADKKAKSRTSNMAGFICYAAFICADGELYDDDDRKYTDDKIRTILYNEYGDFLDEMMGTERTDDLIDDIMETRSQIHQMRQKAREDDICRDIGQEFVNLPQDALEAVRSRLNEFNEDIMQWTDNVRKLHDIGDRERERGGKGGREM